MIELNVTQGSPEWLAARAKCFTASEAPAMMGVSSYMTRSELLHIKATGITPEIDGATQRRFDLGHMAEVLARPNAEKIIGEPLFPIVATDDSGKYLASMDGATMLCDVGFEHKLWNEELAAQVAAGTVPESHRWQLVQQCMVFGFQKILFMVSDGTEEKSVHCWFSPEPGDFDRLLAGWGQFEQDVAAYVPPQVTVAPVGQSPEALPALFIEVTGKVVSSNLDAFRERAIQVFSSIKTTLKTDQDFADADKSAKWCKDIEDRLEATKAQALGQTASIDELFRTINAIQEEARQKRLQLEKLVKAEKDSRKTELVVETDREYREHLARLNTRLGGNMPAQPIAFGEVTKGLKTIASMRDKLGTALAAAKIAANDLADTIEANLKLIDSDEKRALVPDLKQICVKAQDDFANLLAQRISQHQAAVEKRKTEEAEAERIKAEAAAAEPAAPAATQPPEPVVTKAPEPNPALMEKPTANPPAVVQPAAASNDEPLIKLGEICYALGFTVTADFVASLGIHPVKTEKAAKLYPASALPRLCVALQEHLTRVIQKSLCGNAA